MCDSLKSIELIWKYCSYIVKWGKNEKYRKTSTIRRTLDGNKIVDHSDEVGHLHSRLDIWLQGIRQRKPQDRRRIF